MCCRWHVYAKRGSLGPSKSNAALVLFSHLLRMYKCCTGMRVVSFSPVLCCQSQPIDRYILFLYSLCEWQNVNNNKFRMYDFGYDKNLQMYGQVRWSVLLSTASYLCCGCCQLLTFSSWMILLLESTRLVSSYPRGCRRSRPTTTWVNSRWRRCSFGPRRTGWRRVRTSTGCSRTCRLRLRRSCDTCPLTHIWTSRGHTTPTTTSTETLYASSRRICKRKYWSKSQSD